MPDPNEPDDGFAPPYRLGGALAFLVGCVRNATIPEGARADGFRPLGAFGWTLGVVVASDYTEPPAELPIAYREVIVSVFVRRGLALASLPIAMQLDAEAPVTMGHVHYSLPKVLDATLAARVDAGGVRLAGDALDVDAQPVPRWQRVLLAPVSALASVGVRVVTRLVPVVGVADVPHRSAVVALDPRGLGVPLTARVARLHGLDFRTFFARAFSRSGTLLGAPRDLSKGAE